LSVLSAATPYTVCVCHQGVHDRQKQYDLLRFLHFVGLIQHFQQELTPRVDLPLVTRPLPPPNPLVFDEELEARRKRPLQPEVDVVYADSLLLKDLLVHRGLLYRRDDVIPGYGMGTRPVKHSPVMLSTVFLQVC
jgi:hypothetical protein